MNSIIGVAKGVVELLSEYNAEFQAAPDIEVRGLRGTKVVVMPFGRERDIQTRSSFKSTSTISVGVVRKVREQEAEVEELSTMMENIATKIIGATVSDAICLRCKFVPLYDFDQLRTKALFVGVMEAVFVDVSSR